MDIFKKVAPVALVLILSLPAIWSLLGNGYFPMHDDTQVARVYEMAAALRDGQFPVRWVSDLGYGYGYPIFNFYAPLPYYIGGFIHILGADVVSATKIMFALGILLAGITMFMLGKNLWGNIGGIISAIFYVYGPYHAVQIYVRGAVGEYWAYGLLPLTFYGVYAVYKNTLIKTSGVQNGVFWGGVGLAGVILSHNILGMLTTGFLFLFFLIFILSAFVKTKSHNLPLSHFCLHYAGLVIVGLGLSAFFWLPALTEAQYTRIHTLVENSNDYRQHFVYLDQLWDSPWGYGGSAAGRNDGMSFKIGKLHIVVAISGLISLFYILHKKLRDKMGILIFCIIGTTLSIFMMLPISQRVWEMISPLAYVQYPWRFLVFCLFFISLLTGGLIYSLGIKPARQKLACFVSIIFEMILIGWSYKYFQPQYLYSLPATEFNPETISWKYSHTSDEYLPQNVLIPEDKNSIKQQMVYSESDIMVKDKQIRSNLWDITISAKKDAEILFRLAYFPGWQTYIDTHKVIPRVRDGLLTIQLPEGQHQVKLFFGDTMVRLVGNIISSLSIIILITIYIHQRRNIPIRN